MWRGGSRVQLGIPRGTDASRGAPQGGPHGPSTNGSWLRVGTERNHIISEILTISVSVHLL